MILLVFVMLYKTEVTIVYRQFETIYKEGDIMKLI